MDIETVVLRLSDISEVVEVELRKASGGELSVHFYRGSSSNFTSRLFELLKLSKTLIYRKHIQFRKCNTDELRTWLFHLLSIWRFNISFLRSLPRARVTSEHCTPPSETVWARLRSDVRSQWSEASSPCHACHDHMTHCHKADKTLTSLKDFQYPQVL